MTAPQAAGVIHSDFEKGFIRAETVSIFFLFPLLYSNLYYCSRTSFQLSFVFFFFRLHMTILSLLALLPQQEIKDLWVSSLLSINWAQYIIWFSLPTQEFSLETFFLCSWDQRVKSTLLKKEMWCFSASTYNRTLRSQSLCSRNIAFCASARPLL